MKMYFIRHGWQSSRLCNVDVPLAPEGRKQAEAVAARLKEYAVQRIFTSDFIRAVETGEIIGRQLKVETEILRGLREIDYGEMEGLSDGELYTKYADFFAKRDKYEEDLPFPGGENGAMCYQRMREAVDTIIARGEQEKWESVVIVSHGGSIRCFLAGILGVDMARRLQFVRNVENCGITEIEYDREKNRFFVERVNDYAHLDSKLERKYLKKRYL